MKKIWKRRIEKIIVAIKIVEKDNRKGYKTTY